MVTKMSVTTNKHKNMALKLIKDSATAGSLRGADWKDQAGSLVNPETTLFLLNEIDRLQNIIKTLSQGQGDYSRGYSDGWEDAASEQDTNTEELAWAIVDRSTQKVKFDTKKPTSLGKNQVAVPMKWPSPFTKG